GLAVVAERTLVGVAVVFIAPEHAERAGADAVAAAVADVALHVHVAELVVDDRAGGARLLTGGVLAVLADVAHHEPAAARGVALAVFGRAAVADLFFEGDVAPGSGAEPLGVVVAVAGELEPVGGELVPLLAGDLARL